MAHRRREHRDLGYEGERSPVREDEDETQTQNRTMMSPTTALMLHSMNAPSLGGAANDDDGRGSARDGRARRPLGEVTRNVRSGGGGEARRGPDPAGGKRRPAGRDRRGERDRRRRDEEMGPNEALYRREYDGYVTSAISQFAARSSTNLRRGGAALPDFGAMTAADKVAALEGVDRLLERLSVGLPAPPSGSVGPGAAAAPPEDGKKRPALSVDVDAGGETGASAYAAQHSGRSAGSETTMGYSRGGQLTSKSAGSETTMGNNRTAGSETTMGEGGGEGNDTTLLSGSVTTMGQGKMEQHEKQPSRKSLGRSLLGRSLASHADRSVSLLGDSMALLSDDDGDAPCGADGRDAAVPSPAPAVERARHASSRLDDRRPRLELDDECDAAARSPHPGKPSAKRSAADSGGRGLRSRHRLSHDDGVDDSLLGGEAGFGEDDYGDSVMFDELGDGGGGFLSPIGRRSTFDGLDTPKSDGESHDGAASRFSRLSERSDEDEMSFGDGGGDLVDREGDGRGGAGTQRQSQWNAFENADARLTAGSQDSDDDEDGDSPVRRRALRFDQTQTQRKGGGQGTTAKKRRAKPTETEPDKEDEDGDPENDNGAGADGDDDPIQTVNHLCRRAREQRERNGDEANLEEVAPIDIRLRDGAHYRKDPLRCRQDVRLKSSMKDRTNRAGRDDGRTTKGKTKKKKSVTYKNKKGDGGSDLSDPEEEEPPSFPDPTASFPGRIRTRLDACHDFIVHKERNAPQDGGVITDRTAHPSCAVVSMTSRQIVAVASKLLVGTAKACRRRQRSKNGRSRSALARFTPSAVGVAAGHSDHLAGGTLIVLRDKSDVETWTAALRECTSLSVLDHSGLTASVRKSAETAGNAAGFDAVLTTYDCLKAKEVTVPVDLTGRAILGNGSGGGGSSGDDGGGWCTSRGSSQGRARPQKCHQLSILHRLEWYRCVFVDVLGKKGEMSRYERVVICALMFCR